MMQDEATTVDAARRGDSEAFRLLVESHSHDVFRLAYRLTGNEQSADDVVQEAFLKAYRSLHRFDGRSRFGTWLHRIAVNCAMDHHRKQKREQQRILPDSEEAVDTEVSPTPGPDRLTLSTEIEQQLEGALAGLSPMERSAFVLRHFEERPIAEIGRILGARTSATKHAVFRAVRKLRQELAHLRKQPEGSHV